MTTPFLLTDANLMLARRRRPSPAALQWLLLPCLGLACSGDASCIYYPCPLPEAAEISVAANNAPAGIPGLTMAITGALVGTGPCTQGSGAMSVCHVLGGPGDYRVDLSAPGYQGVSLTFTVTGTAAGCNTCGHVDRQALSVVMQPVGAP